MRVSVIAPAALLLFGLAACDGEPLTGPEAQRAYTQALAYLPAEHRDFVVPEGVILFLNDRRVEPGQRLGHLPPELIERIEILKLRRDVAAKLYGEEARGGVIRIYIKEAKDALPLR